MAMTGEAQSFEDYKAMCTGSDVDRRPRAEIEAEIEEAERQLHEGGA